MSRKQGPHFLGMRPPAIAARHRLDDLRSTTLVAEVTA